MNGIDKILVAGFISAAMLFVSAAQAMDIKITSRWQIRIRAGLIRPS
jgi:hypothetical protein